MTKVAFQGLRGAYSEEALFSHFGSNVKPQGFELSEQVCDAVFEDEVDFGILPVENSIVGNVDINLDLFYNRKFMAIAEVYHPIHHCLMALPGVPIHKIKEAHSHPIALAQCRDFLNRHKIKAVADYDTAGASQNLVTRNCKNSATISSRLCADYYGLEIVESNIQKVKTNITRFLVFVNPNKVPTDIKKEKTSMAFKTNHTPGALLKCLQEFANAGINLTKLESRPIPEDPFSYTFYVDFLGSSDDQQVTTCLGNLKQYTQSMKIYGSYPLGDKSFLPQKP